MRTAFRLVKFLKPFWQEVLISILLGIGTVAAGIGLLGTSAYLISAAALHPSIAELQVAIVGVRFFGISRAALRYGERLVSHSVNLRLVSVLRGWFFEHLTKNDSKTTAIYRSGELLDRVLHNLETLENFYVRVVSPYVVFAIITAGASVFVGQYQRSFGWALAGGLFVTGIILPISSVAFTRNLSRKALQNYSTLSASVVESLDGLEELTAFGSESLVFERTIRESRKVSRIQEKISTWTGLTNGLAILVSNLTVVGLVWLAIPFIHDGSLAGILLAVVVQIGMASFESANTLPAAAQQFTQSIAAGDKLFSIAEDKKAASEQSEEDNLEFAKSLSMRKVCFDAGDGHFSLKDISFILTPGKKTALVGPSGAGKSSVVELLLKISHPDSGQILMDDISYPMLSGEKVRDQFGVMGQGDYLFNCSLKENLLLAQPDASDEVIWDSLNKVGLADWAKKLPDGLSTWLGNHGTAISGGEFQRLMLGRVILKKRPFLILDEPLTSLDPVIKKEIFSIFHSVFSESAALWISHEFIFMEEMDEILYIEDGQILERGTHKELMEKQAKYAAAFEMQINLLD